MTFNIHEPRKIHTPEFESKWSKIGSVKSKTRSGMEDQDEGGLHNTYSQI